MTERHDGRIFSTDGSTVDDLVAAALTGRMIRTAESCRWEDRRPAHRPRRVVGYVVWQGGVISTEVKTNVPGCRPR